MDNPVLSLLNRRQASRSISTATLERESIQDMVEAARLAPSCYNKQPWRFLLLESEEALSKGREALAEANRIWAEHAPLLLVGYSRRADDCVLPDGRAYHEFDLGLSVMNLILSATHHGLTARPMAGFSPDKICEAFDIGEDYHALVMIAIGKPDKDESHLPERLQGLAGEQRQRKEAAEIVQIL